MTKPLESPLIPLDVRTDLANAALAYANALVMVEIERDTGDAESLEGAADVRSTAWELLKDLAIEASRCITE